MAAHLLRLRAALLVGGLRGEPAHVSRVILGLILLAGALVAAGWSLLSLRGAQTEVAAAVIVFAGSGVTLGFAIAPLVTAVSDPLDPRRFALVALHRGRLAASLAAVGLVSVPVAALTVLAVCAAIVAVAHGASGWLAAAGAVLGVVTASLLARVSMGLTALFLRERRSRELSGLFAVAILVVVVPVGVFLTSLEWGGRVPTQLREAVSALAFSPLGAAWGLGLRGTAAEAWGSATVAVATIVVLGAVWALLVRRLLTTTERPAAVRERGGLGWFGVAPGTAGGAVAARSLIYWFRDRRYVMNLVVIPITAALTTVPLLIAGVPGGVVALVPVPFVALFLGWLPHNDLAYDSTALWMHVASGVRGLSDRIGRLVPVLLIGIPVLAVACPIAISAHGRWALLPAMVGVCAALFLSGLGLSSVASVVAPYAVSRPGESPFEQPQRSGSAGVIAQGLVMIGAILAAGPALWWGWIAISRDIDAATASLWAGVGAGLGVLFVGLLVGAVVFERGGGRLMEFAEST